MLYVKHILYVKNTLYVKNLLALYQMDERGSRPSVVPRVSDHPAWPGYNHGDDDCDMMAMVIIMVVVVVMVMVVMMDTLIKRGFWNILFMSCPLEFFV